MADIKIKDLRPAGSEFFADNESYLTELTEDELSIMGGIDIPAITLAVSLALSIPGLSVALSAVLTKAP